MAAKVVNITNISGKPLVISTGVSSEPVLAVGETREIFTGIPSRPESFLDALVTEGLVTKATGSGPLTNALSASELVQESDNFSYLPENLHDMSAISAYKAANRLEFFDDTKGIAKIATDAIDTREEVTEAGVDVDSEDQPSFGADEGKKAFLVNQAVTYSAVESGVEWNSLTVTLVDPGVAKASTTFAYMAKTKTLTVTLRNTSGSAIDATATNLVSDFAAAPAAVKKAVVVSGSGASPLTALAATPLAGTTAAGDYAAFTIDIAVSGQADDYSAVAASHSAVVIPVTSAPVVSGDASISKVKAGFEITLTDGTSGKVAVFTSFDPVNAGWTLASSDGTSAEALVVVTTIT